MSCAIPSATNTGAGWRAVAQLPFASVQQQRQSPEVENPDNVELTELHSSQHKGGHSGGERDDQTERHVCRQASRPLAKFPAITGTRQEEMLLICSASLPRHTKQLQFWHSYFSASSSVSGHCSMWSRDFCGCFLAKFLLPDAYACQEPNLIHFCFSHTTIQLLHSALGWCWRLST